MQCSIEGLSAIVFIAFWIANLLVLLSIFLDNWTLLKSSGNLFSKRGLSFAKAKAISTLGPDGILASLRINQVGRVAQADRIPTILFHDRTRKIQLFDGVVQFEDKTLGTCAITSDQLFVEEGETTFTQNVSENLKSITLWFQLNKQRQQAQQFTQEEFNHTFPLASKRAGWLRSIDLTIRQEDSLWVGFFRSPSGIQPRVLATFDPRPVAVLKTVLTLLAGTAVFLIAFVATYLPLHFGLNSVPGVIGGALGLADYILVQPFGVWMRDYLKTSDLAPLGGTWKNIGASI